VKGTLSVYGPLGIMEGLAFWCFCIEYLVNSSESCVVIDGIKNVLILGFVRHLARREQSINLSH
jgi:hypothetical protein